MGLKIMGLLLSVVLAAGDISAQGAGYGALECKKGQHSMAEEGKKTEEKEQKEGIGQKTDQEAPKGGKQKEGTDQEVPKGEKQKEGADQEASKAGKQKEKNQQETDTGTEEYREETESASGIQILQGMREQNEPDAKQDISVSIEGNARKGDEEKTEAGPEETEAVQQRDKGTFILDGTYTPILYAAQGHQDEKYLVNAGYFYIFVRKQGDSPEQGHWYRLLMDVSSLTAQKQQKITWDMAYIGKMPKKEIGHIGQWIHLFGFQTSKEEDNYSLKIEKGKSWEKTRHDGFGTSPVLGEPDPGLEQLRPLGYPIEERYYMLCGKLFFTVNGYRMYFDNSVFKDMGGMDIEPENKQIQKRDSLLGEDEDSWTGDGYFKFAIDTNNVGMTNYGASGEFHHAMYGFYLKPNQYTIKYNANGGSGTMKKQEATYDKSLSLRKNSFVREGYTFKGWNTVKSGGKEETAYENGQNVKNLTAEHKDSITMYAQWEPNVYTVTLENQLELPESSGTGAIYEKYGNGWYLNKKCTSLLAGKGKNGTIEIPEKSGYVFQGYFDAPVGGTKMVDSTGKMTSPGIGNYKHLGNATWYAQYKYEISCEDYADIPCGLGRINGDSREETGAAISLEDGKIMVETAQAGFSASLTGKPAGTKVGQFTSYAAGSSASVFSGNAKRATLPVAHREGAAYQLKVTAQGKTICDQAVYVKNGKFRTLAKLGAKGSKEAAYGSSVAGSSWGTAEPAYPLYQYTGCSELKNIQSPGTVCRYFQYKSVNMAYSGNGATSGRNLLEYNVPLESVYQFRTNGFARAETKTKETADGKRYQCEVKYSFEGWELSKNTSYQEQQMVAALHVYGQAQKDQAVLGDTIENLATYQAVGAAPNGASPSEYINFKAQWNSFPTIVVTPGNSMEFYEGEEVAKADLVSFLTAHDEEDNRKGNSPFVPDLNNKVRIVKTTYPASKNGSQKAYEKTYPKDVPQDFKLDTYYLKLEKEETVEVMVTFAVTDSNGNTTEAEFPVKVKYNNYPEISSDSTFYYFKEEANKGEITPEALVKRASAKDVEDGDLTSKLEVKDFDGQAVKMQAEPQAEFDVTYQVTDAYKKTSYKTVKLIVVDEDAAIAQLPKYYVRYISGNYLDTLEQGSVWRKPENYAYLTQALGNETSLETWKFTHEDVAAVQEWLTGGGTGRWKTGKEANRQFLAKFSYCRQ